MGRARILFVIKLTWFTRDFIGVEIKNLITDTKKNQI